MKNAYTVLKMLVIVMMALSAQISHAAGPDAANYRDVLHGIIAKFDRDYSSLNNIGEPDPGALAELETFLSAFNTKGITQPGEYHFFSPDDSVETSCNVASSTCDEAKVVVRESQHKSDSTLFGVQTAFQWDIIVWMNKGNGFSRFLEGYYSPIAGSAGRGNLLMTSCGGCLTIGRTQLEWDATGLIYHLRAHMYDTMTEDSPPVFSGIVMDAQYNPLSGDIKLAVASNDVCDAAATGDSLCSAGGSNDHTSGYSALVHGNSFTGNVYVIGVQGANNSSVTPSADAMCLKADGSEDASDAVCQADGIDNFTDMQAYAPVDAPLSFTASGNPWPLTEITDTPSF